MVRLTVRGPDKRLPKIGGGFVVARTRGGWALRGPTKPSKNKNHPAVKEQNERFRQAQLACKHMSPGQQLAAYQLAGKSQFLPRDLQTMALYGRGMTFFLTSGERYYSVASRNDMSIVLDALGQTPGAMLYRGTDWWELIAPGTPGQQLLLDGDGVPYWGEASAGGGGWDWINGQGVQPTMSWNNNYATKGAFFSARQDFEITGIASTQIPVNGGTYQGHVVLADTTTKIISAVYSSSVFVSAYSSIMSLYFEVGAPILAGDGFAVLISRTDATGTTNNAQAALAHGTRWPVTEWGRCYLAQTVPSVGDTLTVDAWANNWPCLAARWR